MCVFVCIWPVYVYGWVRGQLCVLFLRCYPPCFFWDRVSHWDLGSLIRLGWLWASGIHLISIAQHWGMLAFVLVLEFQQRFECLHWKHFTHCLGVCVCVFVNLTQTRVVWEEEPQLRTYFYQIGIQARLRTLSWLMVGVSLLWTVLYLGQVLLGFIRHWTNQGV